MEIVVVVVGVLAALWLSGSNWEQRSPYFTLFGEPPPVQPPHQEHVAGVGRSR